MPNYSPEHYPAKEKILRFGTYFWRYDQSVKLLEMKPPLTLNMNFQFLNLAHRIQLPITKLLILNFNEFYNQSDCSWLKANNKYLRNKYLWNLIQRIRENSDSIFRKWLLDPLNFSRAGAFFSWLLDPWLHDYLLRLWLWFKKLLIYETL